MEINEERIRAECGSVAALPAKQRKRQKIDTKKHARRGVHYEEPHIFLLSEKEKQAYDYLYLTSDRVRRARSDLVSYHDTSYALFWIRAAKETLEKAEEALKSNTLF